MDGINGTIFAYGQTAAGKTFSMFGNEQNPGVITRAVHDVFDKVRSSKFSEYLIRGSYVELYNEDIRDLLAGGDGEKHSDPAAVDLRLKIAEDPKTGPFVKGAVERVLEKPEQVVPPMYLHRWSLHLQPSCYPLSPLFTPRCST
jgi:centromeric protein E